jgi:subtilase family serine protease
MARNRVVVAACVAAALLTLANANAQTGTNQKLLISQRVDENRRTALWGNVRPEANASNDRGAVADTTVLDHMVMQLQRSPEQEQALSSLIDRIQTKGSPEYHHWLSATELGKQFGVSASDLKAITDWLTAHGFVVNGIAPSGMTIDFSGTARQVRETFRTQIHRYNVKGVDHVANDADPSIPAALSPAVVGIVSLHDFRPHALLRKKVRAAYTFGGCGGPCQAMVPADLATIYNLRPLFQYSLTGTGQSIVVIEDTNLVSNADWAAFRSTFGLNNWGPGSLTTVHPSGSSHCSSPGVNSDDVEAALDAEWASAAAPNAAIILASCSNTNTTFGGLLALQNLVNSANPPAIVSISYGECEAYNGAAANAAYYHIYQQAAAEGVSVFVSAGDEGAASCDANQYQAVHGIGVSGFASTPYNVAVGGTDFGDSYANTNSTYWTSGNGAYYASAKSYVPEIPWNDSCASTLISQYVTGSPVTYGSGGFCNSATGSQFLTTASGSGGPSGCATGNPSASGVVSGSCHGWAKPSWQSGVIGIPNDGVRDIPDVSLFAADGVWGHYYVFCYSDGQFGGTPCTGAPSNWAGAGGTSFAAPILAAIQALVDEYKGTREGNPNPVYYSFAKAEYGSGGNPACNSSNGNTVNSSCIFYDVTLGDIDVNCVKTGCYRPSGSSGVLSTSRSTYAPAYGTTQGWDFATGLGSINATNLVAYWP